MSDSVFSMFDNDPGDSRETKIATHRAKLRIFETIQNIYGREYLPKAKDVYEWVLTHEADYQHIVLDLVERLAPSHLCAPANPDEVGSDQDFKDDFEHMKAEIRETFQWLHDRALS